MSNHISANFMNKLMEMQDDFVEDKEYNFKTCPKVDKEKYRKLGTLETLCEHCGTVTVYNVYLGDIE